MHATTSSGASDGARHERRLRFRPGDMVVSRIGYPTLFEVICVQDDGLLRVRGLNWPPGHSALVTVDEVCLTTGILRR